MAEALVSDLLRLLQQESKLFVDEDIRSLKHKLETIKPMLSDDKRREAKEEAAKRWLENVEDACYEIDDVLDEWNTELIKSKIEEEEKEAENAPVLKVKAAGDIANRIKGLNKKFDEILQKAPQQIIARQIKAKSKKLDVIVEVTKEAEVSRISPIVDVSHVHSRDMNTLENLLLNNIHKDTNPFVISLLGTGGIGKTCLAQQAFNNDKVKNSFDVRMWVCFSGHFDQIRVANEIIESLEDHSPNMADLQSLLQRIFLLIKTKKFLLVLDDVWPKNIIEWDPFRITLKHGAQGSRIIVTTRYPDVATKMEAYVIQLHPWSDDECWSLFSKTAFLDKDLKQCQLLEDIGREIVKQCRGLPLAAKTLGSFMRDKESKEEWSYVLGSLMGESRDNEGNLFSILSLSYYNLPLAVRRCFTYFAVFPIGEVIVVKDLIQLWMAQSYLPSPDLEILGQQYIETLAMSSFVEDFERDKDDKRIIRCKLPDLVHNFAQSLVNNESSVIVFDGKHSKIASLHESTRHLSLKFARQTEFPSSVYSAKSLRTLLISNTWHVSINTVLPNLLQYLRCLRALNLSSSSIEKLPDEIEKLLHLRSLNLSSNYNIEELPEAMCNLCNLQSLDVSGCYILQKLPQGMGKLINLRYLNLEGTNFMKIFPKGIGRLNSLRTLTKFIVGGNDESEGCKLGELKNMNNLQGALEIKGLGNVVDVQEAKNALLEKKIYLRHLCLDFDGEEKNRKMKNGLSVLDALKPHSELEHLEIFDTIKLPNWMMSLTKLEKLKLSGFEQLETLPPLGKLPSLESLEISDTDSVTKVGVDFLGIESCIKKDEQLTSSLVLFQELVSLKFCDLKELEEWDGIGGVREEAGVLIMPRLQVLTIRDCPKLKALPDFLAMPQLRELSIECCSQISNCNMLLTRLTGLEVLVLKECTWEYLPSLGKLPNLKSLSLWNMDSVKRVGVEFLGIESDDKKGEGLTSPLTLFPMLRSLEFWSFGEWEEWDWIAGIEIPCLPCLHSLIIYNCPKLKSLPSFLASILKDLRISGSPILKRSVQREASVDWRGISHIPYVEIND